MKARIGCAGPLPRHSASRPCDPRIEYTAGELRLLRVRTTRNRLLAFEIGSGDTDRSAASGVNPSAQQGGPGGGAPNYESGGQEFESLRARQ